MIIWLVVAPNNYVPQAVLTTLNQKDCEVSKDLVNSGILGSQDSTKEFVAECFRSTLTDKFSSQ
jgi:hypothetical protein